ncbi:hypothetical protein ACIBG4_37490 [Nonomuraea sp. NPDC050383]|uniref:hypothetical protein n=1 Tax=Nonomuraea sp. NPDC050383 TaxID=3364362 RepID=UPI0037A0CB7D
MLGLLVDLDDSLYSDRDHASPRGHAELSEAIGRAQQSFGVSITLPVATVPRR